MSLPRDVDQQEVGSIAGQYHSLVPLIHSTLCLTFLQECLDAYLRRVLISGIATSQSYSTL